MEDNIIKVCLFLCIKFQKYNLKHYLKIQLSGNEKRHLTSGFLLPVI